MIKLPPPMTFAEGQRALMVWLMAGAGVVSGLCAIGMVVLFWKGGWSPASESQRLTILAVGFVGFLSAMLAVILAMAVGGPVGRFKITANKDGVSTEVEGDK